MPKASAKKISSSERAQVGCHVSIGGGLWNAPKNAADFNCETFQIFSRSPHGGPVKPIDGATVELFNSAMEQYKFKTFVIHAPYFINLGSSNPRIFNGSVAVIRDELERGSLLGAKFVMFHPGSFKDLGEKAGMKQAKEALKKILDKYKGTTELLIEISAGAGSVIGDTFEEIAELMDAVKKAKGFGGICFDTQHAFGSGYDLRDPAVVKETFTKFDTAIGLEHLRMSHVNDSKVEFGSHRDRHEHIGDGNIGKRGFEAILAYWAQKKLAIPLILETEHDKVETDIKLIKAMRDKAWK
jgi:deoxyribonuclease IV